MQVRNRCNGVFNEAGTTERQIFSGAEIINTILGGLREWSPSDDQVDNYSSIEISKNDIDS